ncbi:hypothetical protein EAO74_06950 [Streptomyces sp. gb1(2016)]|uniref:Uncharacterized protein n=1 Tax=Streptomyces sp. gb1(2016) TaxID=1828321 RepID=A0A652L990_9ACTN|nr:hypothetical protein EAO74_06950 [Streptomyces sp. gb1(2016)]
MLQFRTGTGEALAQSAAFGLDLGSCVTAQSTTTEAIDLDQAPVQVIKPLLPDRQRRSVCDDSFGQFAVLVNRCGAGIQVPMVPPEKERVRPGTGCCRSLRLNRLRLDDFSLVQRRASRGASLRTASRSASLLRAPYGLIAASASSSAEAAR